MVIRSLYKSTEGEKAIMAFYDSVLSQWPVAYEALNIPTRHGRTFVIACGDTSAPPLVLLHGSTSNSATWVGDVAEYSQHHRVYAADTLGEPGKSESTRPPWDSPAYAEWLEDIFNALYIERASMVGLSEGGWLAIKFALYKPERVMKLVLLTPGGIESPRLSWMMRVIPLALLGQRGIGQIKRILFNNHPIPKEVDELITLISTHFKTRIDNLPRFSDEELQRLTMPVLFLAGSRDAAFNSEKVAARLKRFLPNLTATIIPEASHVLLMYNTTAYVVPFLSEGITCFNSRKPGQPTLKH